MPQNIIAIVARIRCPMINDESVMKKTKKKTKVSEFRNLKKKAIEFQAMLLDTLERFAIFRIFNSNL